MKNVLAIGARHINLEDAIECVNAFLNTDFEGERHIKRVAKLDDKLTNINKILSGDKINQSRIISAKIEFKNRNIEIINIYVPNGNPVDTEKYTYKINWIDLFVKEIGKKIKNNTDLVVAGDFNIIPEEKDVYAPEKYINDALFKLEIRKKK